MSTCDSCKWWNQDVPQAIQAICNHPLVGQPKGHNDYRGACVGEAPCYLPADSKFVIFTAQKFGCVHHEPKDGA